MQNTPQPQDMGPPISGPRKTLAIYCRMWCQLRSDLEKTTRKNQLQLLKINKIILQVHSAFFSLLIFTLIFNCVSFSDVCIWTELVGLTWDGFIPVSYTHLTLPTKVNV